MTTKYDPERFMVAHSRFLEDATTLTDEDLEQLACVDEKLADRARAKRAGYVEPRSKDPKDVQTEKMPLTVGGLLLFIKDHLSPILGTYKLRIGESREQITALEARVRALEERPTVAYKGVWSERELYGMGQFVTFGGSMWVAKTASIAQRPGVEPHTAWQLVVKRGADGRDGKDLRPSGQGAT